MAGILVLSSLGIAFSQTQPAAKKDSVNADKAAKPVFYTAVAEEPSSQDGCGCTYWLIGGAVIAIGAAGYTILKKKKK